MIVFVPSLLEIVWGGGSSEVVSSMSSSSAQSCLLVMVGLVQGLQHGFRRGSRHSLGLVRYGSSHDGNRETGISVSGSIKRRGKCVRSRLDRRCDVQSWGFLMVFEFPGSLFRGAVIRWGNSVEPQFSSCLWQVLWQTIRPALRSRATSLVSARNYSSSNHHHPPSRGLRHDSPRANDHLRCLRFWGFRRHRPRISKSDTR